MIYTVAEMGIFDMGRYDNRKWVILTASEAEGIDFSKVLQTSADTLAWNNDNTKTFVKYEGSKPAFLGDKTALTHSQILAELREDEWVGEGVP